MTAPIHKIVVIEDDDHVRGLLQDLLESVGHNVVATGDSEKAAELVRREAPDLVLCDVAMPGLDGYGVLRALKTDPATTDTPVIFVTAHPGVGERVRAFKMGAVDYVTAPFTRAALLGKVERILRALARRGPSDAAPADPRATAPEGAAARASAPLPRAAAARAAAGARPGGPRPRGASSGAGTLPPFSQLPEMLRTVLIADDNEDFRAFLSQVMGRHGFQSTPPATARRRCGCARQAPLADPRRRQHAAARRLRALPARARDEHDQPPAASCSCRAGTTTATGSAA